MSKPMGHVIQIDEGRSGDQFGEMVRGTVEEALNEMLDAEADRPCGAERYERSEGNVIVKHSVDGCAEVIAKFFLGQPLGEPDKTCMKATSYNVSLRWEPRCWRRKLNI